MIYEVPEHFLESEVRSGFYVERMMKRNWACMIKVIAWVDDVCRKYGIRYFADFGTLLGALRHRGFIPWDDDVDLSMKRSDYMRFCQVALHELPPGWKILNIHTDVRYTQMFSRIVNSDCINYSEQFLADNYGYPYSTGVDLFPLDYASDNKEEDDCVCNMITNIDYAAQVIRSNKLDSDRCEELLCSIEQMCSVKIDRTKDIPNELLKLEERMLMMFTEEDSRYIDQMPLHVSTRIPARLNHEWYSDTIMLPFEYINVPAPIGAKESIVALYSKYWERPILGASLHSYPQYKPQRAELWKQIGPLADFM